MKLKKSELRKLIRSVLNEQRRGTRPTTDKFASLSGLPNPIQKYPNAEAVQRDITGMDSAQFMNWYNRTLGPWVNVTNGPSAQEMLSIIGLNEKKKLSLLDLIKLAKAIYDFLSDIHADCCQNDSWCCS